MSDRPDPAMADPNGAAPPNPPLIVNLQFIKDLSFEVPNAPAIFTLVREPPRVDIALDVQARPLEPNGGGDMFEVTLQIRADAQGQGAAQGQTCFIAELVYCGIFTLNVPPEAVEPVLLVECPRLLFPFARNILADVSRDGGFPPVMLSPIDFVALWEQRRAAAGAPAAGTA